MECNAGPGAARQYAIEHTTNPYITFIDAGDYVSSKEVLAKIINNLEQYS